MKQGDGFLSHVMLINWPSFHLYHMVGFVRVKTRVETAGSNDLESLAHPDSALIITLKIAICKASII